MINKYGTKISLEKTDDETYKIHFPEDNLLEARIGSGETINSNCYISFKGGPVIKQGMNLKDISEEFPEERVLEIIRNDEKFYIIT